AFDFLSIREFQLRNFGVHAAVQNIGMAVKSGSSKAGMPLDIRFGMFYRPRSVVSLSFDGNYIKDTGMNFNAGLEIMPKWYVTPRFGYKFGIKGNETFTCGLGVNIRKDPLAFRLDYALLPMLDMGMQHFITLSCSFGVKKTLADFEYERKKKEYEARLEEERKARLAEKRDAMLSGIVVAVTELEAKNVNEMEASMVGDYIRSALVQTEKFRVMDKKNMKKVLEEQQFQMSGLVSTEKAVAIGKLLGAKLLISGSFGYMMKEYVMNINVVDVESGQIFYSKSERCKSIAKMEELISTIANEIAEKAAVLDTVIK
ncbi:MAG TPA: CsgG/HfaB family protein, partial [Spirochaetota bacterium]|nr:CsgG/HfaB family protein [Spirochaetota bacterium]